jgi:glycosyltransferase involved in cell wall biosynthesis
MISVVMSVYNCESYIEEAVKSILFQTYTDFEFIIIDDGSIDQTLEKLTSFKDDRIKILTNEVNKGLVYSLNKGLKEAKGEYIARMDGDDISLPQRFEKQIEYMEKNQNCLVCGCSYESFGAENKIYDMTNYKGLISVVDVPVTNPSALIRTSVIKLGKIQYDLFADNGVEDLRFWFEIFKFSNFNSHSFTNLPDILLKYRIHESQISGNNNLKHKISACIIRRLNLQDFFEAFKIEFKFENNDEITFNDFLNIKNAFLQTSNYFDTNNHKELANKVLLYVFLSMDNRRYKFKSLLILLRYLSLGDLKKALLNILGRKYLRRY